MSLTGEKVSKTMELLTYNYLRVCFQDESFIRKVAIVLAEKSPRAEDLNRKLHTLFTAHEGDGADEKLENIKVLVTYLAAQAGGYNSCCAVGDFGKNSPFILRPDQVRQVVQVSQDLSLAIESLVASSLIDPALPHSEQFFETLLASASSLGYASAKSHGYVEDYVSGLVNNLVSVTAAETVGTSIEFNSLSEETKDSFASDLKGSITSIVSLCQDKWSKFFAEKVAAQGQKKGRS